jgi:hypothetical protein
MRRRVTDADGVEWSVWRPFAPWWRFVQPVNIFRDRYRGRAVQLPMPKRVRRGPGQDPWLRRQRAVMRALSLPVRILRRVGMVLVLLPGVVVELMAQGVVGGALYVLRSLRLARHRVLVVGHTGFRTHSVTVLLVRGSRADADRLVEELAAERAGATTPYRPKKLPAHVTVRSFDSAWHPRPSLSRASAKSTYLTVDDQLAAGGSVWRKP